MSRNDEKRLDDIRDMCARVARLVARGRAAFNEDEALWPASERFVEIAGEAATSLEPDTRASYEGVDWKGLLGARVILAHAYHRVDPDRLWAIAIEGMPQLAAELGPLVEDPDE